MRERARADPQPGTLAAPRSFPRMGARGVFAPNRAATQPHPGAFGRLRSIRQRRGRIEKTAPTQQPTSRCQKLLRVRDCTCFALMGIRARGPRPRGPRPRGPKAQRPKAQRLQASGPWASRLQAVAPRLQVCGHRVGITGHHVGITARDAKLGRMLDAEFSCFFKCSKSCVFWT